MSNAPEIERILAEYFTAYENLDFDTCSKIWDFDHPNITLKPTERDQPYTDEESIREYFSVNFALDLEIFRPTNIRVIDFVKEDVAFVFADMVCRFTVKEASEFFPAGHQVRWKGTASFVLHRVKGEWRLIHYEDSTKWNLQNVE